MRIKNILCLIAMCGWVNSAFAVEDSFYLGVGVGPTNTNNPSQTVYTQQTIPGPIIPVTIKPKTTGIGERLFMGYRINPYAATEMGFTHYGNAYFNTPAGTVSPAQTPSARQNAFDFDGIVLLPFNRFAVFAKAGLAVMRLSTSGSMQPPAKNGNGGTSTNFRPLFGVGVNMDLTQRWVVGLSYTRITAGSTIKNSDFLALSFSYHVADLLCGQFLC